MNLPPDASPYLPPAASETPPSLPPSAGTKRKVRIFGILHIVFAILGIVAAVAGLALSLQLSEMTRDLGPNARGGDPELEEKAANLSALLSEQSNTSLLMGIATIISAIPMLIAGILLLRRKAAGLPWSNVYAVSSILAKLAMVYYMTKMNPSSGSLLSFDNFVVLAVLCAYPMVSLFALNRPAVREWLSA